MREGLGADGFSACVGGVFPAMPGDGIADVPDCQTLEIGGCSGAVALGVPGAAANADGLPAMPEREEWPETTELLRLPMDGECAGFCVVRPWPVPAVPEAVELVVWLVLLLWLVVPAVPLDGCAPDWVEVLDVLLLLVVLAVLVRVFVREEFPAEENPWRLPEGGGVPPRSLGRMAGVSTSRNALCDS